MHPKWSEEDSYRLAIFMRKHNITDEKDLIKELYDKLVIESTRTQSGVKGRIRRILAGDWPEQLLLEDIKMELDDEDRKALWDMIYVQGLPTAEILDQAPDWFTEQHLQAFSKKMLDWKRTQFTNKAKELGINPRTPISVQALKKFDSLKDSTSSFDQQKLRKVLQNAN